MRFHVPKIRTAPLILFAIFSIFVLLISGIYHINRMVMYSYKTKIDTYHSITRNVAEHLKQEVENNYHEIQVSANLVAKAGNLTKDNILSILPLLAVDKSYSDIAIVKPDGKGYNIAGDVVDVAQEAFFINAKNGEINVSDKITYTVDNTPVIIYAAPIKDNGVIKGVLIKELNAQITDLVTIQNGLEDNSILYVINQRNELISFIQDTNINNFNYDTMIGKGYLLEDTDHTGQYKRINEIFADRDGRGADYIWNKKSIGINNWSVLVGRVYEIDQTTRDIVRLTIIMWAFITLGITALFTLMIIFQRTSNRKVIDTLYLDPVTGGDNWYKFRIDVNKILNSKQFHKKRYAIINFDINRFKIINDAYGYQKGDEVLKDIYMVIRNWAKLSEPITRYAADQFYIMMSFHEEHEVSDRINDLNDQLHQLRYTSSARIFYGIYYVTERKDSIDRMGEFAGIAKNNIKGNAEGIMSFFDDEARGRLLEEEEIEKSMNAALKNDEFQVYLQPKYVAKDETISGAEALVRWYNNGNPVPPGYFIPVFEKNGFITELDYYMLRKVCGVIRDWLDKGYTPLPISVNISRIHFVNPHLAEIIKDIVDKYDIPYHLIELELTESAFLQNKRTMIETVTQLREYGFLISMDDFGAGYSSLNSLKDLPLDVVKLDGELFRLTKEVDRGHTVIRNTITMAKDLHMKVVAECIETREQVEFLCTVGCDIIQGFYFAKPMPVLQFEERYFSLKAID